MSDPIIDMKGLAGWEAWQAGRLGRLGGLRIWMLNGFCCNLSTLDVSRGRRIKLADELYNRFERRLRRTSWVHL